MEDAFPSWFIDPQFHITGFRAQSGAGNFLRRDAGVVWCGSDWILVWLNASHGTLLEVDLAGMRIQLRVEAKLQSPAKSGQAMMSYG
jgi:hypothetical protein